jgi:hypothetical protein
VASVKLMTGNQGKVDELASLGIFASIADPAALADNA